MEGIDESLKAKHPSLVVSLLNNMTTTLPFFGWPRMDVRYVSVCMCMCVSIFCVYMCECISYSSVSLPISVNIL